MRVLSEAGVRMGRMEDSGESGYLLDLVFCTPLAIQTPRRPCISPVCRAKVSL